MRAQIKYRSFLIRVWSEPQVGFPAAQANWQGEVEHIQSGERWTFATMDALLAFLRGQGDVAADSVISTTD